MDDCAECARKDALIENLKAKLLEFNAAELERRVHLAETEAARYRDMIATIGLDPVALVDLWDQMRRARHEIVWKPRVLK